jgi:REP element-mobilizing transposase RayT
MLEEMEPDDARRRKMIESHLDAGYGSCLLRERTNAEIVVRGWRHFDCVRYRLHVWCVMPTHVHVLIGPLGEHALANIIQSQKSYTAKAILRPYPGTAGLRPALKSHAGGTPAVPGSRRIWHPDYYDRFIRDESHYKAAVEYIHQNPVEAGLAARAEEWPSSSAEFWDRGHPARLR